jgi:hypothetical protein
VITVVCIGAAAALVFGPGVREWLLSLKPAPAPARAKPPKKPATKKPKRPSDE